jgi:hypothetical protein
MKFSEVREQPIPERFGMQPDGSYAPEPSEIEDACQRIRRHWSRRERRRRAAWAHTDPVTVSMAITRSCCSAARGRAASGDAST